MTVNIKKCLFIALTTISLYSFNVFAVEIIYEPRLPYIEEKNGLIIGLVGKPLMDALIASKISYQLKHTPIKRHLLEIKANKKAICAVGWFKNPQREQFAKFTKPIYQDKSIGIVTHKQNDIKSGVSIDDILSTHNITILIKDAYSYGESIDSLLTNNRLKKTKATNKKMLAMIAKQRADLMFISYEEASELLRTHKYKNQLKFISIANLPAGNKRYLLCSKQVDDNLIQRLNAQLR